MNEALGYAASLAVLATFLMQSMGSLLCRSNGVGLIPEFVGP
jgi:hypothetical protein